MSSKQPQMCVTRSPRHQVTTSQVKAIRCLGDPVLFAYWNLWFGI